MSVAPVLPPERGISPLASNNPFRNRVGSGPTSPVTPPIAKATSTNPFLDANEVDAQSSTMAVTEQRPSTAKGTATENTTELFANMNINGKAQSPNRGPRPPFNGPPRRENMPPRPFGRPTTSHRPTPSDERRQREKPRGPPGEFDIFADPPGPHRGERRRPRRNSESSVRDKLSLPLNAEDEKRRRERKNKDGKKSSKSKQPSRRLDLIDRLDVTSIYGTGLFHHDGPFDACIPSRNRKGAKQAPMHAFPADSENMRLGGSGPVHAKLDLDQFNGTGQEAHIDFNEAAVVDEDANQLRQNTRRRSASFNPTARVEPVHGHETAGLGTSTFLEGAPASRAAIARRESENEAAQVTFQGNGLSRTKSLAQRIRGVRPPVNGNRMGSPEPLPTPTSPLGTGQSENNNNNPFFQEYDKEYEKKGAQIAFAEEQKKVGRARAPSSPKRGLGLERKQTNDSIGETEKTGGASGFLNRVKSLKGPRRMKIERRETSS